MSFNLIEYFFPKEIITIDFDFNKETFINRFQEYIDFDRGYLTDEFYISKKEYLGKINSTEFVLRKKRKFMNLNISTSSAKGKITEKENKTNLIIELNGNDVFNVFGKVMAHLFFVITFIMIIVNGIYPLLILFIPFSIAFFIFINFINKSVINTFKENLLKNLNEVKNYK